MGVPMGYHSVCDTDICTGCGACCNACSSLAISMRYDTDDDGSLRPLVDENRCSECGQCRTICPALHPPKNNNSTTPDCYAVCADNEIRGQSSSGGAFTLLATEVLNNGGFVSAVSFGERFRPQHVIVSRTEDLAPLRGSKYVQSDTELVFSRIKRLLDDGKQALFVGCPCQVAGLNAYLQRDYDKLVTVDFVCNYAPPYFIFEKYLEENFGIDAIDGVRFRIKRHGWVSDVHRVTLKGGTSEDRRSYNDQYQRGYHPRLFMRRVCENCRFSGMPRQADLTIGDFWDIKLHNQQFDDTRGTSLVLVNNDKGRSLFAAVRSRMQLCEPVPLEMLRYNRPPKAHPHWARDRFYDLVKTVPFNKAVDYALNNKFDIGIFGVWSERNYGSELTYFALYKAVAALGLQVQMIERPSDASWRPNTGPVLFRNNPYPRHALSGLYETKFDMNELNRRFDTFIVGSDQMWHHDLHEPWGRVCYLDHVYNHKKKIAYATSFGREYWNGTQTEKEETAFHLKDFDHISVRETSGVAICSDCFNVEADWVLDPVFLCPTEQFEAIAEKSDMQTGESYIGVYMLDITPEKQRLLDKVQMSLGLGVNVISDAFKNGALGECDLEVKRDAFIEDWLKNIVQSDFVVTDSFHGMCFAIIFRKPFIAISNKARGVVRFNDLLKTINLTQRLVSESELPEDVAPFLAEIDYDTVHLILSRERERSLAWLKNAIFADKHRRLSEYDVLLKKVGEMGQCLSYELRNNKQAVNRHEQIVMRHGEIASRHEDAVNRHQQWIDSRDVSIQDYQERISDLEARLQQLELGYLARFRRRVKRAIMPVVDVVLPRDSKGRQKVRSVYRRLRGLK